MMLIGRLGSKCLIVGGGRRGGGRGGGRGVVIRKEGGKERAHGTICDEVCGVVRI